MNYLIAGLAKSGTTMLFSRLQRALNQDQLACFFEPDDPAVIASILDQRDTSDTLTKVLIGRVKSDTPRLDEFGKQLLIYRDPRDQFISMLLYLFYDFQISGDQRGYDYCVAALQHKIEHPDEVSCRSLWDDISGTVGRAPFVVFNNLHNEQRRYWETFSPLLVRYESLLDDDWQAVEDYLDLTLKSADTEVPGEYQRVARSKGYGDWTYWLTDEDIAHTNEAWAANLDWLGYAPGSLRVRREIPASTSLDYVAQFNPSLQR
ncbi:MAG: hypothetical protein HRT76_14050 [Halieaceae bacterium]|nr:hypothetical protein [Halieaceae bacterium]